jgi:hypothetical protein
LSSTVTIVLVAGTDARQHANVNSTTATSTILNQKRVKATVAAMLLHNNSLKYIQQFLLVYLLFFCFDLVVMKTVNQFLMASMNHHWRKQAIHLIKVF